MFADHNIQFAVRDGTRLSLDLYRPASSRPCPTVLIRTCYTKTLVSHFERGAFWVQCGFAYVVQDVRGRGDSEGVFYPLLHECHDGSDTIDWIVSQPWSDGRVVMVGGSYAGWTQMYAATSGNPHLVALVPMVTPSDPDRGFPMSYGMILPSAACWAALTDGHVNQDLGDVDLKEAYRHRPLVEFDRVIGRRLRPWRDWIHHVVRDNYWDALSYQNALARTTQSMLHVSGWYDDCLGGALENFAALSSRNAGGEAPAQRLLIGPWLHGNVGESVSRGIDFGESARVDLGTLQRDWFDACLNTTNSKVAPVRLFVMGRNTWIEAQEWPVKGTQYIPYYLHSAGRANGRDGDGTLSLQSPAAEEPDRFTSDPRSPVPYEADFQWQQVGGPTDCANLELREDILVYTGPMLEEPILICGPIRVKIFAATSARDADWMAKVLDVHPDGRAIRLNDGAVRARFRQGHDREAFLTPGAVEEYDVNCWATCIELQPGHRLRLEIASSAFGKYDVNLQGGGPIGREIDGVVGRQTVFHDTARPSRIILPVLPLLRHV
ncbi:MAG: CocE/NonD family hydrolase [Steroidobacteraceae bacterium]